MENACQKIILKLSGPFSQNSNHNSVHLAVGVSRIYTGIIIFTQAIGNFGIVPIFDDLPQRVAFEQLMVSLCGLMLAVGFLTPIALLFLIYSFTFSDLSLSLGCQVARILLLGLILLRSGKIYSVDKYLYSKFSRVYKFLYCVGIDSKPSISFNWLKFGLMVLFWGICLSAMIFHFQDKSWLSGEVLSVALTGSFYSKYSGFFRSLADNYPQAFCFFCISGLIVQAFWETFLVSLMFLRLGKYFVIFQGVAFFLCSIIIFELQFLPFFEVGLWLLLFGNLVFCRNKSVSDFDGKFVRSVFFAGLVMVFFTICFLVVLVFKPDFLNNLNSSKFKKITNLGFKLFGQGPVSVFNKDDLSADEFYMVIYELDENGNRIRCVPYFDADGNRLRYMRNDLICYRLAIPWHRLDKNQKFLNEQEKKPTDASSKVFKSIAFLDAKLQKRNGRVHYGAEIYERHFETTFFLSRWKESKKITEWNLELNLPESSAPVFLWP